MSLAGLAILLSGVGVLATGYLALIFLRDPATGMAKATHHVENLPEVMTDRYVAFTLLAIGATVYQDLYVIAGLFAAFAFMGFFDAWIYARAGYPVAKHVGAGIAATLVVIVALAALGQGG